MRWPVCILTILLTVPLGNELALAVGDFGPDTCVDGFVWREATGPQDHVCVSVETRDQARRDNDQALGRKQPGGGGYGPDTCIPGFVWREASGPNDHVCVEPRVRSQAADDNFNAAQRLKYPSCRQMADVIESQKLINSQNRCGLSSLPFINTADQNFRLCIDGSSVEWQRVVEAQAGLIQTCIFCKGENSADDRCLQFPR